MAKYLVAGLSLFTFVALAMPASAQQCQPILEGKRFTLIVPYAPGGGFDGYARIFASQFEALTDSVMRTRNLPGAGAMIGINAVAEAGSSDLVIGLFNPGVLLNEKILGRSTAALESLVFLGSLMSDAVVWAGRNDMQFSLERREPMLFAMASNTDFTRILLPGYALGWDINLVRGYNGSTEALLALLRKDVDYYYSTSAMLYSRIQSMDGLVPFISLTVGSNPMFPDIPYLAGAGGIVEQLTTGLSVEQQNERQEMARLAVGLTKTHRAISISSNADPELINCLLEVVETAAFSEELRTAAAVQNLVIESKNGAVFQAEIDQAEALIESNWDVLQDLVARSR